MANSSPRVLTRSALFLAIALALQALRLPQPVTGPLINAILFLAAATVGPVAGAAVGALTPWGALLAGILNPALAPAVPAIVLGNVTLVLIFSSLRGRSPLLGVLAAAVAKYVVLSTLVRFVIPLSPALTLALQVPQLFTALAGGAVALALLGGHRALRRRFGPG